MAKQKVVNPSSLDIDWSKYKDEKGNLKPEYQLNKFGYPIKVKELYDPVPMKSKVAFKRPLSAHERVIRAIKTHERLMKLNNTPGDTDFDGPDLEKMTPYQLMEDPISGKEMTAGEYHMLSVERQQAAHDVQAYKARKAQREAEKAAQKAAKVQKKASGSTLTDAETSEDADDSDNADD